MPLMLRNPFSFCAAEAQLYAYFDPEAVIAA